MVDVASELGQRFVVAARNREDVGGPPFALDLLRSQTWVQDRVDSVLAGRAGDAIAERVDTVRGCAAGIERERIDRHAQRAITAALRKVMVELPRWAGVGEDRRQKTDEEHHGEALVTVA